MRAAKEAIMAEKIPVTVLTGFLGSGKTTLLNRILAENHGQRIAVIENEFGEIGVDQDLVINADEEIFEANNGCICCTVRGDLIRILGQLVRRRDRFDRVILETTGLANPGPVAQTFFVDDSVGAQFVLDGIVTLIDAKHVDLHLGESEEAREQVAFADVIVLNKLDLVDTEQAVAVERRIRAMNAMARIVRSQRAELPIEEVLGVGGFDLARALEYKPTFLDPEYPFEWAGAFELEAGDYALLLKEGPDPSMKIAFCQAAPADEGDPARVAERAFPWFSSDAAGERPGSRLEACERIRLLDLPGKDEKRFVLSVAERGSYWLLTEHTPDEFRLEVRDAAGRVCLPRASRLFDAGHAHEDAVGSFSIETDAPLDLRRFRHWLSRELQANGANIYRMKGFLNLKGIDERIVVQGVHMLVDNASLGSWGKHPKRTQLVFIGKNLDQSRMRREFETCLA
jgi:G3E family GTPase